jgi:hypothetical protein
VSKAGTTLSGATREVLVNGKAQYG